MARRIIILEKLEASAISFRYLLWADVPVARQPFYARPGAVSMWKNANAADNLAIATGAVVEKNEVYSSDVPQTIAEIQTALQARFTVLQAEVNAENPWVRYGTIWDDVTNWTLGGVS